jgi:hypothetical protein
MGAMITASNGRKFFKSIALPDSTMVKKLN